MRQYLSRMAAARRWHESTRFTRSSLVCRFFSASRARCALRLPAATREVWRPFGKGQRMEAEKRQRIRSQTTHRADQSPDHAQGGSEPRPRTGRIRAQTTRTHRADQSPDHAHAQGGSEPGPRAKRTFGAALLRQCELLFDETKLVDICAARESTTRPLSHDPFKPKTTHAAKFKNKKPVAAPRRSISRWWASLWRPSSAMFSCMRRDTWKERSTFLRRVASRCLPTNA
jgi:hypothetical protein